MSNPSFLRRTRQAALASALFVALAGAASAQPGPWAGPHGHGGPGGPHGATIEQAIAEVKDKLALNTAQQGMFDDALAKTRAAREAGRSEMIRVREAMKAELAKPEPDLVAVAKLADDARANGEAARLKVRDAWLNLYGTFTAAQKQVVRDQLQQRMARSEAMRERMKERFGDKG